MHRDPTPTADAQPRFPPRWAIHTDQPITRRKAFHILADPAGAHVMHARTLGPLLDHLDNEGVGAYYLHRPGDEEPALLCTRL
jgi:hypothetical protein